MCGTLGYIAAVSKLQHESVHGLSHLSWPKAGALGFPREGKTGHRGRHHMERLLLPILLNCRQRQVTHLLIVWHARSKPARLVWGLLHEYPGSSKLVCQSGAWHSRWVQNSLCMQIRCSPDCVRGRIILWKSVKLQGQPCKRTSGVAAGSVERSCTKWRSMLPQSIVYCLKELR